MVTLLLVSAALSVSDPIGDFGVQRRTCRSWTAAKAHGGQRRLSDETWFWGLLSGLDIAGWRSDENKVVWPSDTPSDFLDRLDRYCASHPTAQVSTAAIELYRYLDAHHR